MSGIRQVGILVREGLKSSFLSRRLPVLGGVFLLAVLVFTFVLLKIVERAPATAPGAWIVPGEGALAGFLRAAPVWSVSVFVASLFTLPWLVLILRHDIPAREMEAGTLRFLTWRTRRSRILFALYLSGAIEIALVVLAGYLLGWILAAAELPGKFASGRMLLFSLEAWARQLPFLGALTACSLFFSVLAGRPRRALLANILALVLLVVLLRWRGASPFSLFHPDYLSGLLAAGRSGLFLRSLGAYLAFNALFFGGAALLFARRDL